MTMQSMKELRCRYERGENIMQLLRESESTQSNSINAIAAAYDLQAGTYISALSDRMVNAFMRTYTAAIAAILDRYSPHSLMEAGVGEATTLTNVVKRMQYRPKHVYGFDVSWSRLDVGRGYANENGLQPELFMGDLSAIPIEDSAIDVVFTSHSIEPNRGCEDAILQELFRVTRKYLVLLEPSNELGSELTKSRIDQYLYCLDLNRRSIELGFHVVEHRLFDYVRNPQNETALLIIAKQGVNERYSGSFYACPTCRHSLLFRKGAYFCPECLLAYPVLGETPCLLRSLGVIATRFLDGKV